MFPTGYQYIVDGRSSRFHSGQRQRVKFPSSCSGVSMLLLVKWDPQYVYVRDYPPSNHRDPANDVCSVSPGSRRTQYKTEVILTTAWLEDYQQGMLLLVVCGAVQDMPMPTLPAQVWQFLVSERQPPSWIYTFEHLRISDSAQSSSIDSTLWVQNMKMDCDQAYQISNPGVDNWKGKSKCRYPSKLARHRSLMAICTENFIVLIALW